MSRNRYRIRFAKQGDLRLISHRDLVRAFERLFRRCELKLKMSEGFHPKPKVSFASALALGIEGLDEVVDLELEEELASDSLQQRLQDQAPDGLRIVSVERLPESAKKPQVKELTYQFKLPQDRVDGVDSLVEKLNDAQQWMFTRKGKEVGKGEGQDRVLDLKAGLRRLELRQDTLEFTLSFDREGAVRPQEVLDALELSDLVEYGHVMTRTRVELIDHDRVGHEV